MKCNNCGTKSLDCEDLKKVSEAIEECLVAMKCSRGDEWVHIPEHLFSKVAEAVGQ